MALDRQRIVSELLGVYGFYEKNLSEIQMRLWCDALAGEDTEAVSRALAAHLADPDRGQFCPKPADVIRMIRGTAQDDALVAWQDLLSQVRSIGRNGSPKLSDAQRAALDGIGGWTRLCNTDESQLGLLQRDFCAGYGSNVSMERRTALAAPSDAEKIAGQLVGRLTMAGASRE